MRLELHQSKNQDAAKQSGLWAISPSNTGDPLWSFQLVRLIFPNSLPGLTVGVPRQSSLSNTPVLVNPAPPPHTAICCVLTFETQPRESQSFRTANGFKGHLTVFTQKEIRIRQIGLPKKTQLPKGETGNRILLRTLPSSACRRTPGMFRFSLVPVRVIGVRHLYVPWQIWNKVSEFILFS